MVGKKTLKSYDFNSMDDYFEYLIDSHINGQFSQCRELFKKLSKDQRRKFINYPLHNAETSGYYINLAMGGIE